MRWLWLISGLFVTASSSCAGVALFVIGFEPATHAQSPIRTWTLAPGARVEDVLDVDLRGYANEDLDVELSRYEAPYRRAPVACKLHVTVQGRAVSLHDEVTNGFCDVTVKDATPARVTIVAENLSHDEVSLHVAPGLPGFARWIKIVWLALALVAVSGALGGVILFRRSAP